MSDQASRTKASVKDPVCGMEVEPTDATPHAVHDGEAYYFCSAGCHAKFTADPQKFVSRSHGAETKAVTAPEGAIWTCPMHPEIQRSGPGSCPICGMALEPAMPIAESGPSAEYRDMLHRFRIGLILA